MYPCQNVIASPCYRAYLVNVSVLSLTVSWLVYVSWCNGCRSLLIEQSLGLGHEGGVRKSALRSSRGGGRGQRSGRLVRVHVAQREDTVVQRVRIRAARAPRASPPHLALLRKHFLRIKRKPFEPHMPSASVRYHEFHCKTPPPSLNMQYAYYPDTRIS